MYLRRLIFTFKFGFHFNYKILLFRQPYRGEKLIGLSQKKVEFLIVCVCHPRRPPLFVTCLVNTIQPLGCMKLPILCLGIVQGISQIHPIDFQITRVSTTGPTSSDIPYF